MIEMNKNIVKNNSTEDKHNNTSVVLNTETTNDTKSESRFTLSESPDRVFIDESITPAPHELPAKTSSAKSSIGLLKSNKIFPQKLPPLKTLKKNRVKTMNKIDSVSERVVTNQMTERFQVSWTNLSYIVERNGFPFNLNKNSLPSVRVILKCLSGSFSSSELTAVMGPSGAGKSTLLSCVCGKRTKGVSGDIKITGCERIRVAIITQNDYLTDKFTLREALMFASKAKNGNQKVDHEEIITNVVNALSLESVINTRLGKCSGGQRRRISIALELMSSPNILILDEPTSGLDSTSCYQIIENLRELTQHKKNPMAIVATIHQPSARVFNMFHKIYVISYNGQCIYDGPPDHLVQHLSQIYLSVPEYHNPSDYMLEIACGEHGEECIIKLATKRKQSLAKLDSIETINSSHKLSEMSHKFKYPLIFHTILLIKRSLVMIIREPHLFWIRLVTSAINGVFLGLLFGHELGQVAGCPPRKEVIYSSRPTDLYEDFESQQKKIYENLGSIFFNTIFLMWAGIMPSIMVFPNHFNALSKQYTNGWYSTLTYFMAKIISELPVNIAATVIYLSIWYILSAQVQDWWRFCLIILIGVLTMSIGQCQGMMCSALLSTEPGNAAYLGIMTTSPFYLFAGFFVRTKRIPEYLRPITYLSYTKYSFESSVITLYGHQRCWYPETNQTLTAPSWLRFLKSLVSTMIDSRPANDDITYDDYVDDEDKALNDILAMFSGTTSKVKGTDKYQSMVMSELDFNDNMLATNVSVLAFYAIVFHVFAYFVMIWKLRKNN